MKRTPEPELMNENEQAKAYTFADFLIPHDLFIEKFPDFTTNDVVLDLGCGPCDITRRFAVAYPDVNFHALDGAQAMLHYAQQLNEKAGLTNRIKLIEAFIPNVKLPKDYYHLFISNSLLHHLHDPFGLWQTIQQHAKPFACVFIMDK